MSARLTTVSAMRCAGCLAFHRCPTSSLLLSRRLRLRGLFRRHYRLQVPPFALDLGGLLRLLLEHTLKKRVELFLFDLHLVRLPHTSLRFRRGNSFTNYRVRDVLSETQSRKGRKYVAHPRNGRSEAIRDFVSPPNFGGKQGCYTGLGSEECRVA